MIARLQQGITLALLAIAIGAGWWAWASGRPAWMPVGAVVVALGYGLVMALEFTVMRAVHGRDPSPGASASELVRAWWGEVTTSPRVFCWDQPFRAEAVPDHLPAGATGPGLLLVHGYVCNRGFWNPWMRRLAARGIPFMAVSLDPPFGSIRDHAEAVDVAARRLQALTGERPVVVGHSMGGLVVRAWLAVHGGAPRVRRVITIGTPHAGTWMARFGTTTNAREMRPDSDLQAFLRAHEGPATAAVFTCFYGHCDNIVYPASTGALPGADNRHLRGVAHVHMATNDSVFDEVMRWVMPAGRRGG